jgi:hypothetical protein
MKVRARARARRAALHHLTVLRFITATASAFA